MTLSIRHDWTTEEIQTLLELPLMELLWQAQTVHREANPGYRVQLAPTQDGLRPIGVVSAMTFFNFSDLYETCN